MAKKRKAGNAEVVADELPVVRYRFRDGARLTGVDPAAAAAELERIRSGGGLTPEAVVETAADPDSPLHAAFEWDDGEAAKQHRLYQARALIRAVVIVRDGGPQEPVYVHVRTEDDRQYLPVSAVVRNPTLFQLALNELLDKLAAARKAVANLRRLVPDHPATGNVERLLNEMTDAAKRVE